MNIPGPAIDLIKHYEGWSEKPYRCPVGIPTIGFGSIWRLDRKRVTMKHAVISKADGEILMVREIQGIMKSVARLIKVPLTEGQLSALVSFTYNLGSGNLQRSTLRMMANRGDMEGASAEFPKWRMAGGQILRGLVRRRAQERGLWDGVN